VRGHYLADNSEGIREGVLGGLGIGLIPIWLFKGDEVSSGQVKIILRDFEPISLPIHAVYPSRRFVPAKVRAMIEFLAAEFGRDPLLSGRGLSYSAPTDPPMVARSAG
jgi:DNA-binding transcriptional LysR family regulator